MKLLRKMFVDVDGWLQQQQRRRQRRRRWRQHPDANNNVNCTRAYCLQYRRVVVITAAEEIWPHIVVSPLSLNGKKYQLCRQVDKFPKNYYDIWYRLSPTPSEGASGSVTVVLNMISGKKSKSRQSLIKQKALHCSYHQQRSVKSRCRCSIIWGCRI